MRDDFADRFSQHGAKYNPHDGHEQGHSDTGPDPASPPLFNPTPVSEFKGKTIPERRWAWNNNLPTGHPAGLYGPPGVSKSLLAQIIGSHIAAGIPLYGEAVSKGPVLMLACEDDEPELMRRQVNICNAMGVDLGEMTDFYVESRQGMDNVLVNFSGNTSTETPTMAGLRNVLGQIKPVLLILDVIPDFWNGNEMDRAQVNRFVKYHIGELARTYDMAVMFLAHPSASAVKDGSGTSGTTGWEGSVRSRLYLKRPDDGNGKPDLGTDQRILARMKANYAVDGVEVPLVWREGYLYATTVGQQSMDDKLEKDVAILIEIGQFCATKGIEVSPANNSPNYYGKRFPDIWKQIDKRHGIVTKRRFERAYTKALMDGAVTEVSKSGTTARRVEFPGYRRP